MRMSLSIAVLLAGLSICSGSLAQPATASAKPAEVPGWSSFIDAMRDLPSRMLAKLPPDMRSNPQIRAEVGRLALEALAGSALEAIGADGDHPMFLPNVGAVLNVGQPNADTVYRSARITPGGTYRLRGRRGSLPIVKVAEAGPMLGEGGTRSKQVGAFSAYHDLNALHVDSAGRYDVLLSPERPAGYTGDWWRLEPGTTGLLIRMISSDWSKEQDPTISIERVDLPVTRPRPPASQLEAHLQRLSVSAPAMALLLIDHVEQLRREGYVNKLKVFDTSQLGALEQQFYYEGAYDLRDDEALIVEAKVPAHCVYRSLILTNPIYETTDWYNNQSSLNGSQAKPDHDGVLRIVVSAKDPGVPNWLDTAGYATGAIQGRWTGCNAKPVPTLRKVALADVRKLLPPETPRISPAERQEIIRDRRSSLQQRPLW